MGRSAFFIRTFGCPVHCPWCDSAGTWHKDYVPDHVEKIEIEQLVVEIYEACPEFAVLTGGEPLVQPESKLRELSESLARCPLHVETCGAYDRDFQLFDHVTVSPKWAKPPSAYWLDHASEFKIIVEDADSIEKWCDNMESTLSGCLDQGRSIWLHPEWSKRSDPAVLSSISSWVKEVGGDYRAGWQLHKLYDVDVLDDRASKEKPPLGGDPALGSPGLK